MRLEAWYGPGKLVPVGVILVGLGVYAVLEGHAAMGLRMIAAGAVVLALSWWLMR